VGRESGDRALLVTALFMTTRFSFSGAHAWASGPNGPDRKSGEAGILQKSAGALACVARRARTTTHASSRGRIPPFGQEARSATIDRKAELLNEPSKTIQTGRRKRRRGGREGDKDASRKTPIFVLNRDTEKLRQERRAKNREGQSELQAAVPSLLREGERGQKLDEEELKQRARAIEAKCLEFDIQGRVTQINPGPVVTTFEFKPEAGIKYSRIIGLTEDLCLALAS